MFLCSLLLAVILAQTTPTGTLQVFISDDRGAPLPGAALTVVGAATRSATSGRDGRVTIASLPPGAYVVRVSAAGFQSASSAGVVVAAGDSVAVTLALTPATLSSLTTIGSTTARAGPASPTHGAAAASVVSGDQVLAIDPIDVVTSLNRMAGITSTTSASVGANRASLGAPMVTQIRGALPYETQSLIDGHPVSVGADGTFSPLLVKPAFLDAIEVVKGPGATSLEQSAAIGGTVNYRLLEPTVAPHAATWFGIDQYGGLSGTLRMTGTVGRAGYALALTADGTTGPLNHFSVLGSALPLLYAQPPYTIDGAPIVGSPIALAPNPTAPQFQGSPGLVRFAEPLAVCCGSLSTGYDSRGVLARLRWSFDPRTALTTTFLSSASQTDLGGARAVDATPVVGASVFAPPAGYAGTLPPGTPLSFDAQANVGLQQIDRQQLAETDLRSVFGGVALLARLYQSTGNSYLFDTPATGAFGFGGIAWGGVTTCPPGSTVSGGACVTPNGAPIAATTTFYNGTPVQLVASGPGTWALTSDNVYGASLALDGTVGVTALTFGLDRSVHNSTQFVDSPTIPIDAYSLAPGSWQRETTGLLRWVAPLAHDRISVTLADYFISYTSRYSGDGGATFATATHTVDDPRLGLVWTPSSDLAVRFGAGSSVAPPYINLLSSLGTLPIANTNGSATAYTQNANDGTIGPETAFGIDAGVDGRLRGWLTASADLYQTDLHGLFLTQTYQQGTYTPPTGPNAGNTAPLFVTKTINLGHARFAGVELTLNDAPRQGLGFALEGSLERAYPYGLGSTFYATNAGPNTANLAIIPGVNFQPTGAGYNGLSSRIPYSQGYGEVNWHARGGAFVSLGATYEGPNNPYNEPAFGVVSARIVVPLSSRSSLAVEGFNLTGAYATPYESAYGGVPVPLVNGKLGATDGGNVGPAQVRFVLKHELP